MLSYILKRILSLLPVLFVVSVVIFLVVYLIPGGPATAMLGLEASAQQIEELNAQLGFDRPFLVQYADWLAGVFRGDWGQILLFGCAGAHRHCRIFAARP